MTFESTSAVVREPERVEVERFLVPSIGTGEALLEVELAGVCGSDSKAYLGTYRPEALPAILGHEILGRIVEIGDVAAEEMGVAEGDRVVVEGRRRCGTCSHCLSGNYQFCERGGSYGFTTVDAPPHIWGGHGEYLYLASGTVAHRIRDDVPAEAAVLACAVVGNSIRWLQSGPDEFFGKSLVIQGCGPQALSMTAIAAELGLAPVVVAGIPGDESRLSLAAELGADETVCAPPDRLVTATTDVLGGLADVVVNLTGTPHSAQDSLELVDVGGDVVYPNVVGDAESTVALDTLVHKNARLQGVLSRTAADVERAIDHIETNPDPFAKLISHVYSVEESERAYRVAGGMVDDAAPLKVAIDPTA